MQKKGYTNLLIKILDEAEIDIENGIRFYEAQRVGLGSYFLNAILADIESLKIYAGIHFKILDYYRMLSKRFPFAIYYKIKNSTIYIYAVLDLRQNPTWLNDRLQK